MIHTITLNGVISRGVKEAHIDDAGHLIFTMSDNAEIDLGKVRGEGGGGGDPMVAVNMVTDPDNHPITPGVTIIPELVLGGIDRTTCEYTTATDRVRPSDLIPLNGVNKFSVHFNLDSTITLFMYDGDRNPIKGWNGGANYRRTYSGDTVTPADGAAYISFYCSSTSDTSTEFVFTLGESEKATFKSGLYFENDHSLQVKEINGQPGDNQFVAQSQENQFTIFTVKSPDGVENGKEATVSIMDGATEFLDISVMHYGSDDKKDKGTVSFVSQKRGKDADGNALEAPNFKFLFHDSSGTHKPRFEIESGAVPLKLTKDGVMVGLTNDEEPTFVKLNPQGGGSTMPAIDNSPRGAIGIMTYNVGRWYEGSGKRVPDADHDRFLALQKSIIDRYSPDIICFQEFSDKMSSGSASIFDEMLNDRYIYHPSFYGNTAYDGKCICTNMTLEDATSKAFDANTSTEVTRNYEKAYVYINGHRVCIISTHLTTNSSSDYTEIAAECDELLAAVADEEYFIICGDLNVDAKRPDHIVYQNTIKKFADAGYQIVNHGEYVTRGSRNTALDNMITSANITVRGAVVDHQKDVLTEGTDHYPLMIYIDIPGSSGANEQPDSSTTVSGCQIETGTYDGTGMSGSSRNANSLTFSFAPKVVLLAAPGTGLFGFDNDNRYSIYAMLATKLTTEYNDYVGFSNGNLSCYGKKSDDGKTFYWYNEGTAAEQCNESGRTYHYIAIG